MTTIAEIKVATAARFGVTVHDLESQCRDHRVIPARHVAMWLSKALTLHTLCTIGRHFGGRDHSTVWLAVAKVDARMRPGLPLSDHVAALLLQFAEKTGTVEES